MVNLYQTTRNYKGKNIYNYSHNNVSKQQINQDSKTHWDQNKTIRGNFTSSKSRTQSRDSIPGSREWHFLIPKSRDWKSSPGLQSLVIAQLNSFGGGYAAPCLWNELPTDLREPLQIQSPSISPITHGITSSSSPSSLSPLASSLTHSISLSFWT